VRIYKKMIQNGIEPLIYDHEILLSNKKLWNGEENMTRE
jgi:hypothetical protein